MPEHAAISLRIELRYDVLHARPRIDAAGQQLHTVRRRRPNRRDRRAQARDERTHAVVRRRADLDLPAGLEGDTAAVRQLHLGDIRLRRATFTPTEACAGGSQNGERGLIPGALERQRAPRTRSYRNDLDLSANARRAR